MLARLRRSSAAVPKLLLATLLLGIGQQVFVVARNPLLAELGIQTRVIPHVQAIGAAAGVLAGLLATWIAPRVRPATVFVACATLQTLGFFTQSLASAPRTFLLGSFVAGLAIQLNTAVAPPVLQRMADADERPTLFAAHSIALLALAGVFSAFVVALAALLFGGSVLGHRAALLAAVSSSAAAIFAFTKVDAASPSVRARVRIEHPRRVLLCVAMQALTALAGGIMLPFLQLYFKLTFGVSLQGVALIYAVTMSIGTVSFFFAPWLVSRLGLLRAVLLLQLLMLPLLLELAWASVTWIAATTFVARHALSSTAAPLSNTFFQSVSQGRDGEAVAGLGMVTSSVTWTLGSLLAGPLLARDGGSFRSVIFASSALFGLVALLGLFVLPHLWRTRASVQ